MLTPPALPVSQLPFLRIVLLSTRRAVAASCTMACTFLVLVSPRSAGAADLSSAHGAVSVDAQNGIAAVAGRSGQVELFDISAPTPPVLLGRITVPRELSSVALAGTALLVGGQGGVAILDISNPRSPQFRGSVELGAEAVAVKAAGNLGYAAADDQIVLFDVNTGAVLDRRSYSPRAIDDLSIATDSVYIVSADPGSDDGVELFKVPLAGKLASPSATWKSAALGPSGAGRLSIYADGSSIYIASVTEAGHSETPVIAAFEDLGSSFRLAGALAAVGADVVRPAAGLLAFTSLSAQLSVMRAVGVLGERASRMQTYEIAGPAYDLTLYGDRAIIAAGDAGLQTLAYTAPNGARELPSVALDFNSIPESPQRGLLRRLTAQVKAADQIRAVEFFVNGREVASAGHLPFEYRFFDDDAASSAPIMAYACAEDLDGNRSCSAPENINAGSSSGLAVVSVTPKAGSQVAHGAEFQISAQFSKSLAPASVSAANVTLARTPGRSKVATPVAVGSVTYDAASRTLVLHPKSELLPGSYRVTLSSAIESSSGGRIPNGYSWIFEVTPATITWTSATSGSWTVATNWSGGKVPANGDNVVINKTPGVTVTLSSTTPEVTNLTIGTGNQLDIAGGTLSVTGTGTADTVNLSTGALAGPGIVSINKAMNWTGGGITGTVDIAAKAVLTMATGNVTPQGFYLSGGTINNSGTVNQSWDGIGYGMYLYSNSVLNNLAGGVWNIISDVSVAAGDNTTFAFNNSGTINKTGGANASVLTIPFNGAGAVTLSSGTLDLSGVYTGKLAAPISISSNAILNYGQGGTMDGGKVTGTGTLNFTASTVLTGAYSFTGITQIKSGTGAVSFDGATTIASLNLISGVLAGPGPISVAGTMNWTGGGITGTLDIPAGATLNMTTGNVTPQGFYISGGVINNSGTVNQSWDGIGYGMYLYNGAIMNNLAKATWNVTSDIAITAGDNTTLAFNNSGTYNKTGGANTSAYTIPFNSSGPINISSGTLALNGTYSGTITSPIAIAAHCALNYAQGGTLAGGKVSGAGTFNFTSGAVVNGAYNFAGVTQIESGSGAVSFNAATSLATLNIISGVLAGVGPITASGTTNWTGGGITGTLDIPTGATLNITTGNVTPSGFYLSGATINNSGTINQSWDGIGYGMYVYHGSVINNLAGATWNLTSDVAVSVGDTTANLFNNSGTFNKSGGANTSTLTVPFNSTGAVNITSGTLALNGVYTGTFTAPISIAAHTALNYGQGGTLDGGKVTGAGTLNFTSGVVLSGAYSFTGLTQINSGTGAVSFNAATTIATLNLISGFLAGAGPVTVSGTMNWTGGSITGVLDIPAAATLNIVIPNVTPSGFYLSGATINNSGTVNHSWVGVGYGMYMYSNSVINNLAGAVWNITSDVALSAGDSTSNVFNNNGTFNKSGGANTTAFTVPYNGPGAVNLSSGTLALNGHYSGTLTAPLAISANCVLNYAQGGTLNGSKVTGSGTFNFTAGTVLSGAYTFSGLTQINSGTGAVNFEAATSIATLNLISGFLSGAGPITVTGTMNWTGGSITGVLDIPAAATLNIDTPNVNSSGFYLSGATINNSGTVNHSWNDEGDGMYMYSGSVINNLKGAVWNVTSDVALSVGDATANVFNNLGTFNKSGGANTSAFSVPFNGSGALNLTSGTFSLAGKYTGTLTSPISVGSKCVLDYGQGGTLSSGNVSGTGTFNFTATASVGGTYNFTGLTQISSGTGAISFMGTTTIAALNLINGSLGGPGSVTVMTTMNWTGGDIISGTLDIPTTATLNIETPNVTPSGFYMSASVLNNSGTVNHSWNGEGYGMYLYSGSTINNLAGATWNMITDVAVAAGDASTITFNNSGTLTKTGGVNSSPWNICLTGSGTVNIGLGTFSLGSYCPTSNLSGPITIAQGAVLDYGQGGTFTGSPAAAAHAGGKTLAEKVSIQPGAAHPLDSTSGSVTGDGNMNIENTCTGNCSTASTNLDDDYNITVPLTVNGGSLNITGNSTIDSLTVTSGTIEGLGSLNVTGTLDMSGGTFDLSGNSSVGNFEISGPTTVVSGTGSIDVSGKMTWSGGSIEGSGTLDVNDLSLSDNSTVNLQLGGRYIAVTADVDLEGNIDFTFAPGTNPVAGEVFQALTFVNAFTGAFSDIALPPLPNGDTWTTGLNSLGLQFTITPPQNSDVVRKDTGLVTAGYSRPMPK